MQEFIVTGQIPGTSVTLTFNDILSIICVIVGAILFYSVFKHIRAQQPELKNKKSTKKATTLATESKTKPGTVFKPTGVEASIN